MNKSFSDNNVVRLPGQITDKTDGWKFIPSQADDKGMSTTASEGYYADRGGMLQSKPYSLRKKQGEGGVWYRLNFDARAKEKCYWAVSYFTADGKPIVADIYDTINAGEKQHYTRYVYACETAESANIFFTSQSGVEVRDISMDRCDAREAAKGCDELYAQMPPLDAYLPAVGAQKLLPKTADALRSGKPWRIVLLGDSIVNDTCNSNFGCLIQRAFPDAKVEFIPSVWGCGGSMKYQEPEMFKQFAADLKPDLLIIGGASNCYNAKAEDAEKATDAVLSMADKLGCEILMLTPGMAWDTRSYDLKKPEQPLPKAKWDPLENLRERMMNSWFFPKDLIAVSVNAFLHMSFRPVLIRLAEKHNVPVLDVTPLAYNYLYASEKPWGWFARDPVHSNVFGKQVNGRLLAAFLSK